MEKIILGLSSSAFSEQFGFTQNSFEEVVYPLSTSKRSLQKLKSLQTPEQGSRQNVHPPVMCLVLSKRTAANSSSDTAKSSDPVAPNRVHRGDSGLSKTLNEALLWNFPHLVKVCHVSSDSVIKRCLTVTQDNDQDTTAASNSTDSSA